MEIKQTDKKYICNLFDELIELKKIEIKTNNERSLIWKLKSLQNTLNILLSYGDNNIDITKIQYIKGIGKGGISRIKEIIDTGYLEEIKTLKDNNYGNQNDSLEINKLEQISGIGNVKSKKLLKQNITFDVLIREKQKNYDLKTYKDNLYLKELTKHQFICLKYHEDISKRIPRKEIIVFDNIISKIFNKIDKLLLYEICGSFRRKNIDSGDIDILFCHREHINSEDLENSKKYLKIFLKELNKNNIIIENLTNSGDLKYMGVCKIPGYSINRRLDIKYVPYSSYIPGLLHFTGSYKENIRLRQIGKEKGYKINEYGIYKMINGQEKIIILNNEKDLYNILQEPYKNPEERN